MHDAPKFVSRDACSLDKTLARFFKLGENAAHVLIVAVLAPMEARQVLHSLPAAKRNCKLGDGIGWRLPHT